MCVLGRKGNPVHISSIENYISTTFLLTVSNFEKPESNGKMVGIVGSGPAGNYYGHRDLQEEVTM